MKKFLLVLAAAGLFCTACENNTSDATLTLKLGGGPKPSSVSPAESGTRVGIGDKVNGYYQLYWTPGDKVLCNGIVSHNAIIDAKRTSVAGFNFENTPSAPYSIVFPAVEGVASKGANCYPVRFLATQKYTEGTFDRDAAVMYRYTTKRSATLNHLTGTIRMPISGEVTISNIVITSSSKPISGIFDLNCETGELTAHEGKVSNQIEIDFEEGLQLKADKATPIYFTVPIGVYGNLDIVITTTDNQEMNFFITCDESKPIRAGIVRQLSDIQFRNTSK